MRAHIERNVLSQVVRVYIFEDTPSGRSFYWPLEYENQAWTWYQAHVPHDQARPEEIRPTFEMSLPMWEAFTKSLLENEHVRVDALDIVAATLKREQDRVDKLIDRLLTPMIMSTGPKQ